MVEMKTEDGMQFPAEAFAYVPDKTKPSTWKLRLWDKPDGGLDVKHVGAAIAAFSQGGFRGNKVEIPEKDVSGVKSKIRSAWKKVNPDKSINEMPEHIKKESRIIKLLRSVLSDIGVTGKENMNEEELKERNEEEMKEQNEEELKKQNKEEIRKEEKEVLRKEIEEEIRKEEASKREQLEKQLEELRKEKEEEEIKKKEIEEEIRKQEFISKAKDYNNLPVDADKFGLVLKEISDSIKSESYQELESVLKSVNESLENSNLFKEVGSNSNTPSDVNSVIEQLVLKKVQEKNINKHKAYSEVLCENPDLARKII